MMQNKQNIRKTNSISNSSQSSSSPSSTYINNVQTDNYSSRSHSSDCHPNNNDNNIYSIAHTNNFKNCNNDVLLIESENVISNLNRIIDSHDSKSLKSRKDKKQTSLLKASSSIYMTTNETKFKADLSQPLKECSSSSINLITKPSPIGSTNGLNSTKKFKSKSFLLSLNRRILDSPSNSSIQLDNFTNTSSKIPVLNNMGSKSISKKSSSNLINIMSSSLMAGTCPQQQQQQQPSVSSSLTVNNSFLNSAKKKRSSLFNLFSFTSNKNSSTFSLSKPNVNTNGNNQNNEGDEGEVFVKNMEENSTSSNSSSSNTDSLALRYRPHSIAFPSNYQTIHRISTCQSSKQSMSKDFRSITISKNTKLLQLDDEKLLTSDHESNDLVKQPSLVKKPSIQSKGFSIPLNASYCLNPIPINCINQLSTNNSYLKYSNSELDKNTLPKTSVSSSRATASSSMCLFSSVAAVELSVNKKSASFKNKKIFSNANLNSERNDYQQIYIDNPIANITNNNNNNNNNNDDDLDDSILFKPATFDLDTEGSCLKELNQRFKMNDATENFITEQIDKNLNEKTCESKNKEYSLKNHLASNESYHDFDNESILMNVDNFNININCSNKNTDIYTNNSKPRSDQHSIRMSASYDNENLINEYSAISPPQMSDSTRNRIIKLKDLNEPFFYNSNYQKDEDETIQSSNNYNYSDEHYSKLMSDSVYNRHHQQRSEDSEDCSNGHLIISNYKKKKFQQTKSLVNIDSQFKRSFDLNNNSVSNEEENLINNIVSNSTNNSRPLSVASISTSKQTPILLAFHSTLSNKTVIEMVQIKKGTKLRDLLKPTLDSHSINIDAYTIYREDTNKSISSIEMEKSCESYSGFRLFLKQNQKSDYESVKMTASTTVLSSNSMLESNSNSMKTNKTRKCSLQMPSNPSTLTHNNSVNANASDNKQINNDSTQINNSSATLSSSIMLPTNNNNNNWQSYFNNKINNSKEKFNIKQKRNSCIAVMTDYSNVQNTTTSPNATLSVPIPDSAGAAVNTNNVGLRDSLSSFQSYMPSTSSINSPENSPTERSTFYGSSNSKSGSRNFRKIAHLSSIFNSNNISRNKEQFKRDQLEKMLETFFNDLPKLPDELNVHDYDSTLLEIEPDWNKFVGETYSQNMPTKIAKQQMAIWELLTTECSHIKTTKIIIDVFLNCLLSLKSSDMTAELFNEIDLKKLFCNITQVFNCNLNFWLKYLHPIVQNMQQTNNKQIDPTNLINGFSNFKNLFSPYEEFILEKNNSLEYFKKKSEENEHFNRFILWAENHPLVGRLKIADFMMIPVQRLTKYELLLKKIQQFTEDEQKSKQIGYIIDCVYSLPNAINIKLKYLAQFNDISESIEKYEGIVGPTDEINEILGTFKSLDIKSPLPGCLPTAIRELIHQGPLKMKESTRDVHCFLFTDFLLITQLKKNKKYKIIKPPVVTNRIVVKELTQSDKAFVVISINDYNVPDSVYMFASNQSKKWIESIELAKKKYLNEIQLSKQQTETQFDFTSEKNSKQSSNLSTPSEVLSPISPIAVQYDTHHNTELMVQSDKYEHSHQSQEQQVRRDSSATITSTDLSRKGNVNPDFESNENEEDESNNENKIANTVTSLSSSKINSNSSRHYQYQQQPNARVNSRIIDRRIQRRNMTDPLSNQIGTIGDEKHSVIMNQIIKRNSLNDSTKSASKPSCSNQPVQQQPNDQLQLNTEQPYNPNQLINLCGDSTSTIMSTDSGVSSASCENNHASGYSDESISKSPLLLLPVVGSQQSAEDANKQPAKQGTTLKATNSVLSTTSTISSASSSSSSSNEPTNISYSSSFNSTGSSTRLSKFSKSLLEKKQAFINSKLSMKQSNVEDDLDGEENDDDVDDDDDEMIMENAHVEEDEDDYVDLFDLNSAPVPANNVNKYEKVRNYSFANHDTNSSSSPYPIEQQHRKPFTTIKARSNSINDAQNLFYLNKNTSFSASKKTPTQYDYNNNNEPNSTSRYFDLINNNNMKNKFQQPKIPLNSSSAASIQKFQQQQQQLKKSMSKQNPTNMVNETIRINPSDMIVKPMIQNNHNNESNDFIDFDSSVISGQTYHCTNQTNGLNLDSHHRMILVKLLNTTMDATEV